MSLIRTNVKKYFGEQIIVDKKMREHRWSYRKYNIISDDNQLYNDEESEMNVVMILKKSNV